MKPDAQKLKEFCVKHSDNNSLNTNKNTIDQNNKREMI